MKLRFLQKKNSYRSHKSLLYKIFNRQDRSMDSEKWNQEWVCKTEGLINLFQRECGSILKSIQISIYLRSIFQIQHCVNILFRKLPPSSINGFQGIYPFNIIPCQIYFALVKAWINIIQYYLI